MTPIKEETPRATSSGIDKKSTEITPRRQQYRPPQDPFSFYSMTISRIKLIYNDVIDSLKISCGEISVGVFSSCVLHKFDIY